MTGLLKRNSEYEERSKQNFEARRKNQDSTVKNCLNQNQDNQSSTYSKVNKNQLSGTNPLTHENYNEKEETNAGRNKPISSLNEMLSPKKQDGSGMTDHELNALRHQEEVREFLESSGLKLRLAQFQTIWYKALELEHSSGKNTGHKKAASMGSVLEAMKELHVAF